MVARLLIVLSLGIASCRTGSPTQTKAAPPTPPDVESIVPKIPPQDIQSAHVALDKLQSLGDAGNHKAALLRAHYLLDLFDSARFARDAKSRSLLARILGWPAKSLTGAGATQAMTELLILEFDHILEQDRQNQLGSQGRIVANFDNSPPDKRVDVFQRIVELKRIATGNGKLSANANLRLFGYCKNALVDAASFARRERRIAISHCLYPLYAANPEPYFSEKAKHRPPPPQAKELIAAMRSMLSGSTNKRLEASVASQLEWLHGFEKTDSFVTGIPIEERLLPFAKNVVPYDDFPLVGEALTPVLQSDGRGVAAIALSATSSAADTLALASSAAKAGAHSLAIIVAMEQTLEVPRGDYWSLATEKHGSTVRRAGQFQLSLAQIDGAEMRDGQRSVQAKAGNWDPSRAALKLHLLISPNFWRLVSPRGVLATIPTSTISDHPRNGLRAILSTLRKAFPDEDGLILVPDKSASHAAIVTAATAARHDDEGNPLFGNLAIRPQGPGKVRKGKSFLKQVHRRASALVIVSPTAAATNAPIARQCYLQLLDKTRKKLQGEVRMERKADGSIRTQAASTALAACADKAFQGIFTSGEISALTVRFELTAD